MNNLENNMKNKYLKYKEKYNKLKNFYNLFEENYQTAGKLHRENEYCYLTNKKFEENDFVSQCSKCNNWGLVTEMIKSKNCKYCNNDMNHNIELKEENINNIMELINNREDEDLVDIGLKNLYITDDNDNDDDNDDNKLVDIYNKRLLQDDKLFNNSYNDYNNSNNLELKELLLQNTHNLIEQVIPQDYLGTYEYHNKFHKNLEENNEDDSDINNDSCLYCIYNKIL